MEKLESDLENFVRLCHLYEKAEKLEQALAEKDQEIAKWKAAHAEMVSRNKLLRDRPDLPADRIQAHDEWVEKYQQLMEKSVRFAEGVWQFIPRKDARQGREAYEFLQSSEVQAWKELKK